LTPTDWTPVHELKWHPGGQVRRSIDEYVAHYHLESQILRHVEGGGSGALVGKRHLIVDRDTKYSSAFREFLVREGIEVIRLPVLFENLTYSRRGPFVEVQHPAKARPAINALGLRLPEDNWGDQLITETLMVAFVMVMIHIFAQGAAQHRRANRYQFRYALTFNGSDEAL
jgi:hypothetical protein